MNVVLDWPEHGSVGELYTYDPFQEPGTGRVPAAKVEQCTWNVYGSESSMKHSKAGYAQNESGSAFRDGVTN